MILQKAGFVNSHLDDEEPKSDNGLLKAAGSYHRRGVAVVPIPCRGFEWTNRSGERKVAGGKGPIIPGWQKDRLDWARLEHELTQDHIVAIGAVAGRLSGYRTCLDFDGAGWLGAFEHFLASWPELERTAIARTGSGKRHVWIICADMPDDFTVAKFSLSGLDASIELRGHGMNCLLPPSLHPSGGRYEWLDPEAESQEVDFAELYAWLAGWGGEDAKTWEKSRGRGPMPDVVHQGARRDTIMSVTSKLASAGLSKAAVVAAMEKANEEGRFDPPLTAAQIEREVASNWSQYQQDHQVATITEAPEPQGYHLTDIGNGQRLAHLHGSELRFCYPWGKWLVWDGLRWKADDTAAVERRAKATVATIYAEAAKALTDERRKAIAKHAMGSESRYRLRAMIDTAQSEPGIPVLPDELDKDQWVLNCENGTLDLRSGRLHPHRQADLITKLAPVAYDPGATCPRWLAFLDRIMAGNTQLIGFLQRAVGYSLTGDTSEQCFFILHGSGANGKSTFLQAITAMLGDYAKQTPTETLLIKRNAGISNDVAALKGSRMVSALESESGSRLAESLVKGMTGGDTLAARFLYQEWFEFMPMFKIFLGTNHKPIIRGNDHAIWRRIRLIPFTVTIPEKEQDTHLPDKLQEEFSGILSWAVKGCLEWQQEGLGLPQEVREATSSYRDEMDILGGFIDDCCTTGVNQWVPTGQLYITYQEWCTQNGQKAISGTAFGRSMSERGFDRFRNERAKRCYLGIGLKVDDERIPLD